MWRLVALLVLLLGGCAEGVAGAAEGLFAEAWRNEGAGAPAAAVAGYTELTTRFPESPLAPIARERVAGLSAQLDAVPAALGNAFEPGDFVCTIAGLYPRNARWCGLVREVGAADLLVEVKSMRLNSFWAWGIAASTCTGGRSLGFLSYGEPIWVPRRCIAAR